MGSVVTIISILLKLAEFFARRADKNALAEALSNEVLILQGKRVRDAAGARNDSLTGRLPVDDRDFAED